MTETFTQHLSQTQRKLLFRCSFDPKTIKNKSHALRGSYFFLNDKGYFFGVAEAIAELCCSYSMALL